MDEIAYEKGYQTALKNVRDVIDATPDLDHLQHEELIDLLWAIKRMR